MKTVLIVSHTMELGGAERALLGLLEHIDHSSYHVDLFLLRHQGELLKYIPEEVNCLSEDPSYSCLAVPITEVLKKRKLNIAFYRYLGKKKAIKRVKELGFSSDNGVGLEYSHKYTEKCMPMISNKEYDVAISFLTPHYFVRDKVKAKKKIAWIHTDYSEVAIDTESELPVWAAFDEIVAVSDGVKEQFLKTFPSLSDKITVIENILPMQMILKQAEEKIDLPYSKEKVNILSVGRFSYAKNFDNVPEILQYIHKEIPSVKWYLIGYGGDEDLIRRKIHEYGMEDDVIIIGKKENPYPYIKACDLYVQPSRYEGKSITVREAQILGKPVIITNYKTAASQLEDGVDGVIVPMDTADCAERITQLLRDKKRTKQLVNQCINKDFTNKNEIIKLYNLIENI